VRRLVALTGERGASRFLDMNVEDAHAALNRATVENQRLRGSRIRRDEAIREAISAGVSLRQVAETVGISHQRVAQIVKES
jgi:hypothetical protein